MNVMDMPETTNTLYSSENIDIIGHIHVYVKSSTTMAQLPRELIELEEY